MKPHNDTKEALRLFGFESLRNEQIKPIEALRNGKSIFVNAPTSTGKSLIYQLPAVLHRNRLTIVIEPTISLMLDQIQKLNRLGFAAAHLDSSLSQKQRQEILQCLDQLTFLYTTPEQLIRSEFIKMLKGISVYQIVIDEAHCVLDWGYSFRDAYLELRDAIGKIAPKCVSAFTATATPEDEKEIQRLLGIEMKVFRCRFERMNLIYAKKEADSRKEKLRLVKKYLKKYDPHRAVIYCNTRKAVEGVFAEIEKKYPGQVGTYHSGLTAKEKTCQQIRFCSGEYKIIVATSAFGMGIPSLADMKLSIMELTANLSFPEQRYVDEYLGILKNGCVNAHYRRLYFDKHSGKAKNAAEANRHSYKVTCKQKSLFVYDKTAQLLMTERIAKLPDHRTLRIEVSLRREAIKKEFGKGCTVKEYLEKGSKNAQKIVREFLKRLLLSEGQYYPYDEAIELVQQFKTEKTRQRAALLIQLCSRKKSLDQAIRAMRTEHGVKRSPVERVIRKMEKIGLSPLTIPIRRHARPLPSLLSLLD